MENNITVELKENIKINISSDSPDFSELVKKIIEIDDLDLDKIVVESTDTQFDKNSFEEALKEAIKEIKDELRINREKFEIALDELNKLNKLNKLNN